MSFSQSRSTASRLSSWTSLTPEAYTDMLEDIRKDLEHIRKSQERYKNAKR